MTVSPLLFGSLLAASGIPQAGISTPATGTAAPAMPVTATPAFDEDPPPRLSLPTESDRALWRKPGFRFGLGLVYGRFYGIGGAPNYSLIGPSIRAGLRLDEAWSLMGSLRYLYASGAAGAKGIRFAGTIEPTWHATEHLALAAGIGFGGIVEQGSSRTNPPPTTLDTSYTFPDASQPLPACNGVGVAGLLRAQWLWVMGPRMSTGLSAQFDGQWTGCVDDTGVLEPDTATPVVRRQWWPHLGGSLTWEIEWR